MKRPAALVLSALLVVSACVGPVTLTPTAASVATPTNPPARPSASSAPTASPSPTVRPTATPLAPDPAEAVIPGVERNAQITFWTFYLSPAFDSYVKETIARFEATYPGVKVTWQDHQGTFQDDLKAAFAADKAPDVMDLSVSEGWVSEYASKGVLLPLDDIVPAAVRLTYFPGLWNEQLSGGRNFQFPWYQGANVELLNKRLFADADIAVADFPRTIDGLPALCRTLKVRTRTACDIHLAVGDLIAQMVYEANVKPLSPDGRKFRFDSADAVSWLTMYRDMVAAGTVDRDIILDPSERTGMLLFASGQAPFYATGLNVIREIRANNAQLYGDLAVARPPVGTSGVIGKGVMGISVSARTKFPNASIALAQFFTNARSMVAFSKVAAIYPSVIKAYDDPFFSSSATTIEDAARATTKDVVSHYEDIVPHMPPGVSKAEVNAIVLRAIQDVLFNKADPQKALSSAVAAANKLIK